MNADRNWERNEPNERDSRVGSQRGFQFSDAYGPGGGAAGNRVINDIHCKNATFDQQGFPDGAQLLPEEHGRGHGHGHGRGRGGREDEGPRGRFDDERDGRDERDERGQWEHGGHGKWEKGGPGGRGHGGHKGHHGHGRPPSEELDADGQPIAGSVEANEMGMNAAPVDANGNPIYQTMAQPVDYSSQSYNPQMPPADYASQQSYDPQTLPADYASQQSYDPHVMPADYSSQSFSPQTASADSTATGADPLVAQLSATNPDVAKVLTDAQTQMTPQGYAALSQLMQQNLSTGGDCNTALLTSIGQMQQLGGQELAPDVAALQTVIQTDAPNLLASATSADTSGGTSDATAQSSTDSTSYPSTGYTTPTSAAV